MQNTDKKTVVVGMSGGVDSSVAALLLKQQGFDVIGLFMKNWEELDENGQCSSAADYEDVQSTCARIGIPYQAVNFVEEYRDQVFAAFLADYKAGRTPNPDILCNREIKFKVFFEKAMDLGADFLATGHYCRAENGRLLKGFDSKKDQSYFLSGINGKVLDRVLFPLGGLKKERVREIAFEYQLPTHAKKDSTGICFIGERDFTEFLSRYIKGQQGEFRRLDGRVVGCHRGSSFYTVGQRRHLGLGGPGARWYVVDKDMDKNIVYVERGESHPALFCDELYAEEFSWIGGQEPAFPLRCYAKVRYRQADQECVIEKDKPGQPVRIVFSESQRAIAQGQVIAFYQGEECLGAAVIARPGESHHKLAALLNSESQRADKIVSVHKNDW